MKKLLLLFCLIPFLGLGQNLVQNGDFETATIPTDRGQISYAVPWTDECTHPWLFTSGGSGADLLDRNSLNPIIQVPDNIWGSIDERNGNDRYAHLWQTQNTPPEINTAGERMKGTLTESLNAGDYDVCVWGARATEAIPSLSDPYQAFEVYLVNESDCDDVGKLILTSDNMTLDVSGNSVWTEYCAAFTISTWESGFYNKILIKIIEPGAPITFTHTQSIYIDGVSVMKACEDVAIDFPTKIEVCDGEFEMLCGPYSTIGGPIYTYEWWGPDPDTETSVLLSETRCFTPEDYGSYMFIVTDQYGCETSYHFIICHPYPFLPEIDDIKLTCDMTYPVYAGWHDDPFEGYECFYEIQWTFNGEIVEGMDGYNIPYMGLGTYCVYVSFSDFSVVKCFEAIECCKPNPEFAISWYMGDNPYTIEINNYPEYIPHYDSEVYIVNKDCNNDGMPGPWEFVASVTREGAAMSEPLIFDNLDGNCLYRVMHGVSKFCMMQSFIHVEYVGGSPGFNQKSTVDSRSKVNSKSLEISPNPAIDMVQLTIPFEEGNYELIVFDLNGKIVKQFQSDVMKYELDISDLNSGLYIIRASNESSSYTGKMVKE